MPPKAPTDSDPSTSTTTTASTKRTGQNGRAFETIEGGMSLSNAVSELVRKAMKGNAGGNGGELDMDKYVTDLIMKDASRADERYQKFGLAAYTGDASNAELPAGEQAVLASGTIIKKEDSNGLKTNKRFLSSIIKSTESHNRALIKQEEQRALELKLDLDSRTGSLSEAESNREQHSQQSRISSSPLAGSSDNSGARNARVEEPRVSSQTKYANDGSSTKQDGATLHKRGKVQLGGILGAAINAVKVRAASDRVSGKIPQGLNLLASEHLERGTHGDSANGVHNDNTNSDSDSDNGIRPGIKAWTSTAGFDQNHSRSPSPQASSRKLKHKSAGSKDLSSSNKISRSSNGDRRSTPSSIKKSRRSSNRSPSLSDDSHSRRKRTQVSSRSTHRSKDDHKVSKPTTRRPSERRRRSSSLDSVGSFASLSLHSDDYDQRKGRHDGRRSLKGSSRRSSKSPERNYGSKEKYKYKPKSKSDRSDSDKLDRSEHSPARSASPSGESDEDDYRHSRGRDRGKSRRERSISESRSRSRSRSKSVDRSRKRRRRQSSYSRSRSRSSGRSSDGEVDERRRRKTKKHHESRGTKHKSNKTKKSDRSSKDHLSKQKGSSSTSSSRRWEHGREVDSESVKQETVTKTPVAREWDLHKLNRGSIMEEVAKQLGNQKRH